MSSDENTPAEDAFLQSMLLDRDWSFDQMAAPYVGFKMSQEGEEKHPTMEDYSILFLDQMLTDTQNDLLDWDALEPLPDPDLIFPTLANQPVSEAAASKEGGSAKRKASAEKKKAEKEGGGEEEEKAANAKRKRKQEKKEERGGEEKGTAPTLVLETRNWKEVWEWMKRGGKNGYRGEFGHLGKIPGRSERPNGPDDAKVIRYPIYFTDQDSKRLAKLPTLYRFIEHELLNNRHGGEYTYQILQTNALRFLKTQDDAQLCPSGFVQRLLSTPFRPPFDWAFETYKGLTIQLTSFLDSLQTVYASVKPDHRLFQLETSLFAVLYLWLDVVCGDQTFAFTARFSSILEKIEEVQAGQERKIEDSSSSTTASSSSTANVQRNSQVLHEMRTTIDWFSNQSFRAMFQDWPQTEQGIPFASQSKLLRQNPTLRVMLSRNVTSFLGRYLLCFQPAEYPLPLDAEQASESASEVYSMAYHELQWLCMTDGVHAALKDLTVLPDAEKQRLPGLNVYNLSILAEHGQREEAATFLSQLEYTFNSKPDFLGDRPAFLFDVQMRAVSVRLFMFHHLHRMDESIRSPAPFARLSHVDSFTTQMLSLLKQGIPEFNKDTLYRYPMIVWFLLMQFLTRPNLFTSDPDTSTPEEWIHWFEASAQKTVESYSTIMFQDKARGGLFPSFQGAFPSMMLKYYDRTDYISYTLHVHLYLLFTCQRIAWLKLNPGYFDKSNKEGE